MGNTTIDKDSNTASVQQQLETLEIKDDLKEYEYQHLSAPTEQRFLLLDLSDCGSDELRGKIIHRELSTFDQSDDGYIAASYVWGAPAKPHQILLDDGSYLHITENCFLMLRRVRSLADGKPLWVDAICINQTDNDEKSIVIEQMASIYSLAAQVIVYIGEANEYDDKALERIQRGDSELTALALKPKSQHPDTLEGRVAKAAHEILERTWFSRSWVIQEVIKGGDRTTVICGATQLRWMALYPIIFFFWPRRVHPPCVQMAMNYRFFGKDNSLQRLLPQIRYCDATDPRDKVFSLLGIASDAESVPKLDYHMSKEQVYTKIAVWWVEYYGSLELLAHADDPEATEVSSNTSSNMASMASWVPDWSKRPSREILGVFEKTCFCAGGSKAVTRFPDISAPSSHPILLARGMFIGTAKTIISHCKRYTHLISIFRKHGGYGSEEANEQALSSTLRFGYTREHTPSVEDKWHVFDQYKLWKNTHCDQAWELKEDRHGKRILDEEYLPCYDNRPVDIKYEGLFRTRRIGRVLAITDNGFFCFAPDHLKEGDVIYVLYGSSMPVVLRKVADHYVVLGQCYVSGIMYGEVLPEERLRDDPKMKPFLFRCELPKFERREEDVEIW